MTLLSVSDLLATFEFPPPTIRDTNPDDKRLTWDELVARDPRLGALYRRVFGVRGGPDFCANELWYGRAGFKAEMWRIVGEFAHQEDAALITSDAYEVAYHTLYHLLPDCRHEGMCRKGRS